ncbi:hypothetical protein NP233_g11106 [Leucocoprinus birnbaumii]|uniref:Uncharacterized protein n=1 Tax=Leucocoprinus birnbaumii TaxID=56174 RepID=A0AAD5VH57_9AGAR|nr:hypothetical protein NP233_g11106 [Leucocoprinus birnbaumii]
MRLKPSKLQDGANSARSDDISRIRANLASWLNKRCGSDPLDPEDRVNRGLQHDVCGKLLCPIDFNWDDLDIRAAIRNGTSASNINDSFFLRCLYQNDTGNPEDLQHGFLRNILLRKMNGKVTGRSIAYTAVILVFNLTDAVQWTECHNGFDFRAFYEFIVDYFEDPRDNSSRQRVKALLQFWNRSVFPGRVATGDTRASSKRLASQCSSGDSMQTTL